MTTLSDKETTLLEQIKAGAVIERQYRGRWGWHPITGAEAAQYVQHGEAAWLRVKPAATDSSSSAAA